MKVSNKAGIWIATAMLAFAASKVAAQEKYFVYLQSDKQQPFYAMLNGRNISSSPKGYAILPKLHDSTYEVKIGFPGISTVQYYELTVAGSDRGYLLKSFGEKGWGLFDLQTMQVVMSSETPIKQTQPAMAQTKVAEKPKQENADAALAELAAQNRAYLAQQANKEAERKRVDSLAAIEKAKTNNYEEQLALQKATEEKRLADSAADAALADIAAKNRAYWQQQARDKAVLEQKRVADSLLAVQTQQTEQAEKRRADELELAEQKRIKDSADLALTELAEKNKAYIRQQALLKEMQTKPSSEPVVPAVSSNVASKTSTAGTTLEYKDGNETVIAFFPSKDEPATKPTVNPVKKEPEIKTRAEAYLEKSEPAASKPTFLEMEILPDTSKPIKEAMVEKEPEKQKEPIVKSEPTVETPKEKRKIGLFSNNSNTKVLTAPAEEPKPEVAPVVVNKNCKEDALEKDFFDLRKKMVVIDDVDEMMLIAKKAFKEKCYSTDQIRNLCVLFLNDADRYSFLDIAYPFASDKKNYPALQDLLKDKYNLNRFKALINN